MLLIFAFLCSITNSFKLQGTTVEHVMSEMVNYHPVTMEAQVQSQAIRCRIFSGQSDTGVHFSHSIMCLLVLTGEIFMHNARSKSLVQ
jgi:hypothetical protein